jgi:hypothetical protein
MEAIQLKKIGCHNFQIDLAINLMNYGIGLEWDGKSENGPSFMPKGSLVPCDCGNFFFYVNGLTNGLFRLGGQLTFSIFYLHTQINTTFHVGITPKSTKISQKKPSFEARPSVTAPPPPLPPSRTAP